MLGTDTTLATLQHHFDHGADGAEAYLGTTFAGFPSFFMIIGPNTGSVSR